MSKKHKARKIFKKANKILRKSGGDHCSFIGIDVPYFDGFENIVLWFSSPKRLQFLSS